MLKIGIAIPFMVHGLAHTGGFLASWTKKDQGFSKAPWIFSEHIYFNGSAGKIFGMIWLFAAVLFVFSGIGIIANSSWWETTLFYGAIFSIVSIIPWWNTVPFGAKIGFFFNVLILIFLHTSLKNNLIDYIN